MNVFLNSYFKTQDVVYVIFVNTDSAYVCFDTLLEKGSQLDTVNYIDKFSKEVVEPEIANICSRLAAHVNMRPDIIRMKRESIAEAAVFVAKNRYVLLSWDDEGVRYKEPKLKIVGMGSKRSNVPLACKDKIKQVMRMVSSATGTEKETFECINAFEEHFKKLPVEQIATPVSANNLAKYSAGKGGWKERAPVHVKAAIIYNHLLKDKELTTKYPTIHEGEKMKYAYLKIPNPFGNNAIGLINSLPQEIDAHRWIDYNTIFEKNFLSHVEPLLLAVGWKDKQVADISAFME